jgi:DNA-binding response OmpR family regulator
MKKILVIESDKKLSAHLAQILIFESYCVMSAHNLRAGLFMAERIMPDLILWDIDVEEDDMQDTIGRLGKDPLLAGIPFIIITTESEKYNIFNGYNLNASDYILKPFNEKNLLHTVRERFRRNEMTRRIVEREMLECVSILEEMLAMVSHGVRKPMCTNLGLLQMLNSDKFDTGSNELGTILTHLKNNTLEIDEFTKKLTDFMYEAGNRYKNKISEVNLQKEYVKN